MLDVVYVLVTVVFFALMLGYVSLCEHLGHSAGMSETHLEIRA